MAMFLSSLRVFTSLVQDMSDELQDAVLYALIYSLNSPQPFVAFTS